MEDVKEECFLNMKVSDLPLELWNIDYEHLPDAPSTPSRRVRQKITPAPSSFEWRDVTGIAVFAEDFDNKKAAVEAWRHRSEAHTYYANEAKNWNEVVNYFVEVFGLKYPLFKCTLSECKAGVSSERTLPRCYKTLYWFPFVSTTQTRLLFHQSRGLQIQEFLEDIFRNTYCYGAFFLVFFHLLWSYGRVEFTDVVCVVFLFYNLNILLIGNKWPRISYYV